MQAHVIREAFGLENLVVETREVPEPGPGQLRIALAAASLNYRDLLMVKGAYDPRQPLPLVPGSDGAGVVDAVGPGAEGWEVGDRVVPGFHQAWLAGEFTREMRRGTLGGPLDGTLAGYVLARADACVAPPAHLSDEEAACLPCAGLTAWVAVVEQGGVRAGDTVLVQGTGGVSTFALQFAKAAGARVIVTSSSAEKLAAARERGADEGIDYVATPDWHREVKRLTGGRGADLVVEVGGAGTLARSLGAVRVGGNVQVIGVLSGRTTELDLAPVLMQRLTLQGVIVGSRASFEAMNRAIDAHEIRPVIDRVFDFADAPAAFRHLESGGHQGKIVVRATP